MKLDQAKSRPRRTLSGPLAIVRVDFWGRTDVVASSIEALKPPEEEQDLERQIRDVNEMD